MARQIGEREGDRLPLVAVMEFEVLKIADEDIARTIPLRQRVEVLACLTVGLFKIATGALLLN